jgi:hypothetical protein
MAQDKMTSGTLVLMGSEGVGQESADLWKVILEGQIDAVELVALPGEKPSLVFQARLGLIAEIITGLGIPVARHEGIGTVGAKARPRQAIVLSAEAMPAAGDAAILADCLLSGGWLIAGATAAAGLGISIVQAARPLPPNPDEAIVERVAGLGMVSNAVILPYIDVLPEGALDKVRRVLGMDLLTVGIDQGAALVVGPERAWCAGFGKVSLLRDNDRVWMGTDGDTVPNGLISLKLNHPGETT